MAVLISLLVWLAIYLAIGFATGWLYRSAGFEGAARVVFLPGFLLVGLVRAGACAVTGMRLDEDGKLTPKHAAHGAGKDGHAAGGPSLRTRLAFALLPFTTCTVVLVALFAIPEELPVPVSASLEDVDLSQEGAAAAFENAVALAGDVFGAVAASPSSWQLWASLYAAAALLVAGAPRKGDLLLVAPTLGGAIASLYGFEKLGVGAGLMPQAWVASFFAGRSAREALAFVLCLALFTLVLSAVAIGGARVVASLARRKERHEGA